MENRYLVSFNTKELPFIKTDFLIIGSGVAGLRCALEASKYGKVLIVTKDRVSENNTGRAQGGVAVVLNEADSKIRHINDTLRTGRGLCERKAVEVLVEEGQVRVKELIEWGANFDREEDGKLSFSKEGGHSVKRIIHARGDATGEEVERVLVEKAEEKSNIHLMEHTFVIDLLTREGVCFGALIQDRGGRRVVFAKRTILASGGAGLVYRESTNSTVATGDGVAMAYRAGVKVVDMEFMQFHPTTLYLAGASRALISEAARGEGAVLRNKFGERFMPKYHSAAELAPRDVVSRCIFKEMRDTESPNVLLDMRHLSEGFLKNRFPYITKICSAFGIKIHKDLIPVIPTAHYMIGGVKTDLYGRTNVERLYACGEVACVGVHGANRLPSNSLLEGLVFGYRVGYYSAYGVENERIETPEFSNSFREIRETLDVEDVRRSLRSLMWRVGGVERSGEKLEEALHELNFWSTYIMNREFPSQEGLELQNMLLVAYLITQSALKREESRGVHFRNDYPHEDDMRWRKHIELMKE
jgi:L-aspartate oxidase